MRALRPRPYWRIRSRFSTVHRGPASPEEQRPRRGLTPRLRPRRVTAVFTYKCALASRTPRTSALGRPTLHAARGVAEGSEPPTASEESLSRTDPAPAGEERAGPGEARDSRTSAVRRGLWDSTLGPGGVVREVPRSTDRERRLSSGPEGHRKAGSWRPVASARPARTSSYRAVGGLVRPTNSGALGSVPIVMTTFPRACFASR